MNLEEYNKVKEFPYEKYCNYLKEKYGKVKANYFTEKWKPIQNIRRTKEGLIIHHIREDEAPMLSNAKVAKLFPYEYQSAENLVYCNYLEHLLLHILITEETCNDESKIKGLGEGGITVFLVPELNDWYAGMYKDSTSTNWKVNCYNAVKEDKETYLKLIERYIRISKENGCNEDQITETLLRSFNTHFGLWSDKDNKNIYEEIKLIIKRTYQTNKSKRNLIDKIKSFFFK